MPVGNRVPCRVRDLTLLASNKLLCNCSQMLSEDRHSGSETKDFIPLGKSCGLTSVFICAGSPHSPNPMGVIERACDDTHPDGQATVLQERNPGLGGSPLPRGRGHLICYGPLLQTQLSQVAWSVTQGPVLSASYRNGVGRSGPMDHLSQQCLLHSFKTSFQMHPITFYVRAQN